MITLMPPSAKETGTPIAKSVRSPPNKRTVTISVLMKSDLRDVLERLTK
jgi:hypothetical protein